MGEVFTAAQVRAAKIAAMPAPLGELHFALWNEVAWLHVKWADFLSMFGANPETIAVLNRAAPSFFQHPQNTLWEDALLHICRLTDPPRSAGKPTLTIRQLPAHVGDTALRERVACAIGDAKDKSDFARDWRNRRLAHKELPPLDGTPPTPLAQARRRDVEGALAAIREVMNLIERQFEGGTVGYEYAIGSVDGVNSLLFYLKKGLEAQRCEDR